ncbi:MAG: phosphoglycerate dehydrogenase [Clostridia bacterium]|nr:phosphoglycerate dehydrogenase [Clostridia bacterium]
MTEILKLNDISKVAENALGNDYTLVKESADPKGIMLRSFNMHDYEIPSSVLCVGRAGAGVNNIPIPKCSEQGIVVFNTPGANANAVKELVLCGLLLASRKVTAGIEWTNTLKGTPDISKQVEKGKKAFVGPEIAGKTLGIIGLGAIGALVANAAIALGMKVIGYDPYISIDGAWHLDNHVIKETDLSALFAKCDYVTLHVPLTDSTRELVNKASIENMKDGIAILNFARGELVNNADIIEAVKSGKVSRYVTDFACDELLGVEDIICTPHLGASTPEAEDNCAVMVARQMVDFFENGNIVNSVNLPRCQVARQGKCRITVFHRNIKNVINSITTVISEEGVNIANLVSQSKGDYAYIIIDLDDSVNEHVIERIKSLDNIIRLRVL